MNKSIIKFVGLLLVFAFTQIQCTDDFEDLNKDPFNPESSTPALLFNSISRQIPLRGSGDNVLYIQNHHSYDWAQLSASDLDEDFEVEVNVRGIESIWRSYYNSMRDIRAIEVDFDEIDAGPNGYLNVNRRAILDIVSALMTLRTTDLYGDMPYTDAGQGKNASEQIFRPRYDSQESIYRDALAKLENASKTIDIANNAPDGQSYFKYGKGETIFNSDMTKWQKLANTLILRYAAKISNVDEAETRRLMSLVLDGNLPLPENDDEVLKFSNDLQGVEGRVYWAWEFYGGIRMGENIWNHMSTTDATDGSGIFDPRAYVFFETNADDQWVFAPQSPDEREDFTGHPYITERNQDPGGFEHRGNYSGFDFLLVSDRDHGVDFQTSFAEVCFLRAEAYQRGWANGDPKEWYEKGITSSINRWYSQTTNKWYEEFGIEKPTVTEEDIAAYINHERVAWNEAEGLKQIHTQLWIDYFLLPNEAWFLARRSGLIPMLDTRFKQGSAPIGMPTRIVYPEDEKNNNQVNYQEASSRYSEGDSYFSKLWWDK